MYISDLTKKEKFVLMRRLQRGSFGEIAEELFITQEAVRQIEARAVLKYFSKVYGTLQQSPLMSNKKRGA